MEMCDDRVTRPEEGAVRKAEVNATNKQRERTRSIMVSM